MPFRAIVASLPIKKDQTSGSFKLLIKSRVLLALIENDGRMPMPTKESKCPKAVSIKYFSVPNWFCKFRTELV